MLTSPLVHHTTAHGGPAIPAHLTHHPRCAPPPHLSAFTGLDGPAGAVILHALHAPLGCHWPRRRQRAGTGHSVATAISRPPPHASRKHVLSWRKGWRVLCPVALHHVGVAMLPHQHRVVQPSGVPHKARLIVKVEGHQVSRGSSLNYGGRLRRETRSIYAHCKRCAVHAAAKPDNEQSRANASVLKASSTCCQVSLNSPHVHQPAYACMPRPAK